jgi:hypothetical protein
MLCGFLTRFTIDTLWTKVQDREGSGIANMEMWLTSPIRMLPVPIVKAKSESIHICIIAKTGPWSVKKEVYRTNRLGVSP